MNKVIQRLYMNNLLPRPMNLLYNCNCVLTSHPLKGIFTRSWSQPWHVFTPWGITRLVQQHPQPTIQLLNREAIVRRGPRKKSNVKR